jgi:hypothetical protein
MKEASRYRPASTEPAGHRPHPSFCTLRAATSARPARPATGGARASAGALQCRSPAFRPPAAATTHLVLVGVGAGELAAVVHAAADGLAAVALAAISPELVPGCLFWIEGYPGFPAGSQKRSWPSGRPCRPAPWPPRRCSWPGDHDRAGRGRRCRHPGRRQRDRHLPGRRRRWLAGRPRLGEFEGTGIHYAPPLIDARLWAGKPQRSGNRQFGRTSVSDVVLFPARSAVPR